ncbi:hypothetical protein [Gordonia soli]|uniref:Uncharacterized protein n=1 Tax=Gordonia soli NBRC 108243 TaxID=1223545 RepID=M0QQS2_9ACTN|nr:hypothetical protein [Gordonia soli]GAC69782.1 hypothetical protein GS4_28_00300 [Gordonia soli NBRC 108243]
MQAVEINAGTWYLRALRADDRISDVPALSDLGIDDPNSFVVAADAGWATESRFVWAVCIPTTGELIALIGVDRGHAGGLDGTVGRLWGSARAGHDAALTAAEGPVGRFADSALGLRVGPCEPMDLPRRSRPT